jgi:hypothetical protein
MTGPGKGDPIYIIYIWDLPFTGYLKIMVSEKQFLKISHAIIRVPSISITILKDFYHILLLIHQVRSIISCILLPVAWTIWIMDLIEKLRDESGKS